jgi:hypothetical protein
MVKKTSQFLKTGYTARMICEITTCSKCAATSENLMLKSFSPLLGTISTMQQERKPVSSIGSLLANDKENDHSFQNDSTFVMI